MHEAFEFCSRSELIAVAAYEQLGFQASVKELEIIGSIVDCADRQTKPDQRSHARIRTGHTQSHRSAKGKSGEDYRQMKFVIQPVQRSADVLRFSITVVVLTLTQSRSPKIKPQHGIAKTVQRLHGMKHDFVVQRSAIKRMRMANQRCMSGVFSAHIEQGFQPAGRTFEKQRAD